MSEVKRTCNRCGTFWYVDTDRLRMLKGRMKTEQNIGVMGIIGSLLGNSQATRNLHQAANRQDVNRLELEAVSSCPRCRSSDFQ